VRVRSYRRELVGRGGIVNPDVVFVVLSLFLFAASFAAIWAFEKV
jgi:hypothetical protein